MRTFFGADFIGKSRLRCLDGCPATRPRISRGKRTKGRMGGFIVSLSVNDLPSSLCQTLQQKSPIPPNSGNLEVNRERSRLISNLFKPLRRQNESRKALEKNRRPIREPGCPGSKLRSEKEQYRNDSHLLQSQSLWKPSDLWSHCHQSRRIPARSKTFTVAVNYVLSPSKRVVGHAVARISLYMTARQWRSGRTAPSLNLFFPLWWWVCSPSKGLLCLPCRSEAGLAPERALAPGNMTPAVAAS